MKILIAFYSRAGNNYVNGSIRNLPVGNTEVSVKILAEALDADLFQKVACI